MLIIALQKSTLGTNHLSTNLHTQQQPAKLHVKTIVLSTVAVLTPTVGAGPIVYGICQSDCAAVVVACYIAAGATFGTVATVAAPAVIVGYSTEFGACSTKCAAVALLPFL